METLVIFVVWLLSNQLVNVTETFIDVLKYYFLQMNAVKFMKCTLYRSTLKHYHTQGNCPYSIWL